MAKISVAFDATFTNKTPESVTEGYTPLAVRLMEQGYTIYMVLPLNEQYDDLEKRLHAKGFKTIRANNIYSFDLTELDVLFIFDFIVPEDGELIIPPRTKIVSSFHTAGPVYVEDVSSFRKEASERRRDFNSKEAKADFDGKFMLDIYTTIDFFLATNYSAAYDTIPKEFPAQTLPLETCKRPSETFCAIPAGAFRFESYVSYLSENNTSPDSIIIFPTGVWHECGVDFIKVIETILESFPEENVIYRPTPLDRTNEYFVNLKNHFNGYQRIQFDLADDIKKTYSRGKVMLSDYSASMFSFALSALRPVIRLSTGRQVGKEGSFNSALSDKGAFLEEEHGYFVSNLDQMVAAIRQALASLDDWNAKLLNIRDKSYCNVGGMADYLADNFDFILDPSKRNPEWNYYERAKIQKPLAQWSREDFIRSTLFYSDNRYEVWGSQIMVEGWKLGAEKYPDLIEPRLTLARFYLTHKPAFREMAERYLKEAALIDYGLTAEYFETAFAEVQEAVNECLSRPDQSYVPPYFSRILPSLKGLKNRDDLYIYGAGEHTKAFLRFFGNYIKIAGIIDRAYVPESRFVFPVHRADEFDYHGAGVVIISSKAFEGEIYEFLLPRVGPERIITLYGDYTDAGKTGAQ